jgi:hypothetical protein
MVAGMLLVGQREEPFLEACLESLAPAIDLLVVNDNSPERGPNREALERSTLARTGRLHVRPSTFLGFGPCRMLCLEAFRTLIDRRWWVLKVDADEVHHDGLPVLTRELLPRLSPHVGIVDGFFLQLCASPRYYLSVDRRHDLLFRFHPDLRYDGQVHERLLHAQGRRIDVPYRFFHYGYVAGTAYVRRRWRQYGELGDAVSGRQAERVEETIDGDARRARPYLGRHPVYAEAALEGHRRENADVIDRFESVARAGARDGRRTAWRAGAWQTVGARWRVRGLWSRGFRHVGGQLTQCERQLEAP